MEVCAPRGSAVSIKVAQQGKEEAEAVKVPEAGENVKGSSRKTARVRRW